MIGEFVLNEDQQKAFDLVKSGKNVYVSGSGGVGKSVLIKYIQEHYDKGNNVVYLAPTGIAALNIGGATIHSTFKFPIHVITKKERDDINRTTDELFCRESSVEMIVIDEISMVRLDIFEAIDRQLKTIRRSKRPFGGLQVVVVGDFYQLPPIVAKNEFAAYKQSYDSRFCFGGNAWAKANFEHVKMTKVMRQKDEKFIKLLNSIRTKDDNYKESLKILNQHGENNVYDIVENDDPTYICTINRNVDRINDDNYRLLDPNDKEITYHGIVSGDFGRGSYPAPEKLTLKVGTKVLLTVNSDQYKNGQVAYVIDVDEKYVKIILEDTEEEIKLEPNKWMNKEYHYNVEEDSLDLIETGSYTQIPLRYGWAVSCHRAQGVSLDSAVIDMGYGAFDSGQTYVALSRVRTLEGLGLLKPIRNKDIIVDEEVKEFYDNDCKGISLV